MKIKMLRSVRRSPDNHQVKFYTEGESYDVPKALGEALVSEKNAIEVKPKPKKR